MGYEFLCLESEVPKSPDCLVIETDIGQLAVRRSVEGDSWIEGLRTTCKHMGASLMRGSTHRPVCAIHGTCHDRKELVVPLFNAGGLIFRGQKDPGPEMLLHAVGLRGPQYLMFDQWTTRGIFTRQMWIENTIDVSHIPYVHAGGFGDVLEAAPCRTWNYEGGNSLGVTRIKPNAVTGLRKITQIDDAPNFRQVVIGRNLSVTNFADVFFSVEHVGRQGRDTWGTKIDPGTVVTTKFLYDPKKFIANGRRIELFLQVVRNSNREILNEDKWMLDRLDKTAYESGKLELPRDARIAHHRAFHYPHHC